jgi:virginiamycin B lyase
VLRYITRLSWGLRALFILTFAVCLLLVLHSVQASFAYRATVSARDFYVASGSDPWGTAIDHNGNIWLAVPGCDPNPTCSSSTPPGKIEEFSVSSSKWIKTVQLPSGYGQALFGAFDSAGNLWFPAPMSNALEMYNPSNNSFAQWKVPTANALPWAVAVDQHGNIWFTEHGSNKVGYFTPGTHTFREIATPASNSNPYGITVDSHNNIWFTENNASVARIGEYTSSGSLKEYKIRNSYNSGLTPHLIKVDHSGNVWWSEGFVGAIGELNVAQAVPGTNNGVKEFFYPRFCSSCGTHTSGISVDGLGNVWFDDSMQSLYGSFNISSGKFSVYHTPTSNSHPHDGLHVDGYNNIWFNEEFANKLAKATE